MLYLSLNALVYFKHQQLVAKQEAFDLNNNGFIDNEEITPESRQAVLAVTKDTAKTFAPIVLIPISLLLGGFIHILSSFIKK